MNRVFRFPYKTSPETCPVERNADKSVRRFLYLERIVLIRTPCCQLTSEVEENGNNSLPGTASNEWQY